MCAKRDFIIHQGEDWSRTLTWKTGSPSLPVDLTSASAVCKIRLSADSEAVIAQPTITLGGTAGTIKIALTKAQTLELDFTGAGTGPTTDGSETRVGKLGVYDLEVTVGGLSQILVAGQIGFLREVSR